jgi:hypothetical protein
MINLKFENNVLNVINTLGPNNGHFIDGTLFVPCDAQHAAKIETALLENLDGGVIVSRVGPEFAFDFTE